MKLLIKAIVFMSIIFLSASADLAVIIDGGFNISNIRGDGVDLMFLNSASSIFIEDRKSFNVGAGVELEFKKWISAIGKLSFVNKGYEQKSSGAGNLFGDNSKIDNQMKLMYLSVPIHFKLTIPIKRSGIFFIVGPETSFLLSAKAINDMEIEVSNEVTKIDTTYDAKNHFNAIDFGIGFSIGGEIAIGKHALLLSSGYSAGITDIFIDDPDYYKDIKNGTFFTNLGWMFKLKKD